MEGVHDFLVLNNNRLSYNMRHLSGHINTTIHKINYFNQTSKMVVDLGSNIGVSNYEYY